MSDKKLGELKKKAESGDADAGVRLATLGARSGIGKDVLSGLKAALKAMKYEELRELQTVVANELARNEDDANFEQINTVKATQIHGPSIGKVTPAKLISILDGVVNQAVEGKLHDNEYIEGIQGQPSYGWSRGGTSGKTRQQNVKDTEKAFENYSGDYVVSCSSPIRIYALKRKPSEEEIRRRAIERKKAKIAFEQEQRKKALEESKRKQAELEAELERLKKRDERIQKKLAKYEE